MSANSTMDSTAQRCAALQADFFADRAPIIAADRGPVTFGLTEDGDLRIERGAGGLVTALAGLSRQVDTTWIVCAAGCGSSTPGRHLWRRAPPQRFSACWG